MTIDLSSVRDSGHRATSPLGDNVLTESGQREGTRPGDDRYRALADCVPHGIVDIDQQFVIVATNPAFRRLTGTTEQAVVGVLWWTLLADVQDEQSQRWLERCLADGETTGRTFFHRLRGAAGHDVDVRADWSVRRDAGGAIAGYTAVLTDLTAINAAEARRRILEAEFVQRQRLEAVGTLASGIAHDVNNQLLPVLALSSLLLDEVADDDSLRPDLKTIFEAAGRASALIKELQELSRLGAAPPTMVDPRAVLGQAVERLKGRLSHQISLTTKLEEVPSVLAAPARLEQAIGAILSFVADVIGSRPAKLEITLDTLKQVSDRDASRWSTERGPWVHLVIDDDGPGIDPATRQHLFEPLASGKTIGPDTGLGLAVAHRIVTRLGGSIACASQPGRGTTFTLLLPAAPAGAAEPPASTSP